MVVGADVAGLELVVLVAWGPLDGPAQLTSAKSDTAVRATIQRDTFCRPHKPIAPPYTDVSLSCIAP